MDIIQKRSMSNSETKAIYQPEFFRIYNCDEQEKFSKIIEDESVVVCDEIVGQLRELIKGLNPSVKIKDSEYPELIQKYLQGKNIYEYGVWVYYPWSRTIVHLLDEEEFVEVRTNRNRYKITREEQTELSKRKIGIIGLSVGQSIALTLAMERTCGELRLADFDTAELSNLNRIRTGVHNLGIHKTVIAAREIAEIDPFLKISIFNEGVTKDNINEFFTANGKIDLLVEVCDGLDVKVISRFKARELNIPVVMDTNDRGMLDVERFDLEPERPILHGLADGLDTESIKGLTNEEKIPYILKMVGAENISTRLKASMIEVEQSINTWPQLASSVVLGGALTTDVCRRIFLDQYHESGRYYVDLDELVGDKLKPEAERIPSNYLPPTQISKNHLVEIADSYQVSFSADEVTKEQIDELIKAAVLAPSGGNCQPWMFIYRNNFLYVFHDLSASYSFLDFNSLGAYLAIGAAIENIKIQAKALGLEALVDHEPIKEHKPLIAVVGFQQSEATENGLEKAINIRLTNRTISERALIEKVEFDALKASVNNYWGATLEIVDDVEKIRELGDILATTEKLVLMHPRGHFDAFNKELRWTEQESKAKRDGLDVATLGISKGEVAAMRIANDAAAIGFVRDTIKGGAAFKKMALKAIQASSAVGILCMPEYSEQNFLLGGEAVERIWLEANLRGISFQPISQFTFLQARLIYGQGLEMNDAYRGEFSSLRERFFKLLPHLENQLPVFTFRLCKAEEPTVKSLRKPTSAVYSYEEAAAGWSI